MLLQVNRIAYPVSTLGPGRRIALWVQGCSRRCPGCASVDTWDPHAGRACDVDELAETIADHVREEELEGLSITGGEPVEQAGAVACLIEGVRDRLEGFHLAAGFNVLLFTGGSFAELKERSSLLAAMVDAAVCGPYEQENPRAGRLLASGNQHLMVVNDRMRTLFETYNRGSGKSLQFEVDDAGMHLVGMPDAGDLDRLEEGLRERGVDLGGVSWRS